MGRTVRLRPGPKVRAALRAPGRRAAEAQGRYELLAANTRDIIFFTRPSDGRILDANLAAVEAYGYTLDELKSLAVRDLRAPEQVATVDRDVALADAEGIRFETVHRRRDGSTFPVEVSSSGATIGGQRLLVAVIRDMTARREVEDHLRASEERLRLLVEHTPAAVAMFDREMRYLAVSRRYLSDYHLVEKDLLGRSHYDVFPEIPERWRAIHRRCLAGAVEASEEDPFPRGDGTLDWVKWEICPWRDARGNIGGVTLFSELVTARRLAEERLAAEHQRVAVTLQSIGDAVIATDRDARVTVFNEVAQRLTGWSAEEAIGRPLSDVFRIVSEDTHQPMESPVERVLYQGAIVGLANHTVLVARDGNERPIADSGAPIRGPDGTIHGVVLVFRDQTEERRAQDELRHSEQRLRLALDAAQAGTWEWNLRTNENTWSDGLWGLYGLQRGGRPASYEAWRASVHPEDRQRVDQIVGEAARTGAELRVEWRVPQPNGLVRWLASQGRPIRDADGTFTRFMGIVLDVTDRREAEEALRESEEKFRALVEQAADAVLLHDLEGRLRDVNPRACEDLGYSREELLRMTVLDLDPSLSLATAQQLWAKVQPDKPFTYVSTARRKDGTKFPIEIRLVLVIIGGERLIMGHARDITERLRAEEAIRNSEYRYRAIFEQAAVGVAEVQIGTGRFLQVNGRLCEFLGYGRDELLTLRWQDVTHPDDRVIDEPNVRQMEATGNPYAREKRYLRRDGTIVWASLMVNPLEVPGVAPTSQIAVIADITARKVAEERFRAFTERSSDLTIVLDEKETITFVSPASQQILGLLPSDMVGKFGRDFVHPDDALMAATNFTNIIGTPAGTAVPFNIRLRNASGGWTLLEAQGRNMLDVPAVRGLVINHRDVTERNSLREQFQQAQKLESVGRLAGGVAHDFNNLLTVILSCTASLEEALSNGQPGSVEDIREIDTAAKRAAELTGQLLAFARKQIINPVPVDLGDIVLRSERMLRRLLGEDIDLRVERQPELWTTSADPGQVTQVIVNLAVNARDAMPAGGTLLLQTMNVTAAAELASEQSERLPGDWVRLVIRDSGTGMSDEVKAHIFEPFFTTKEQGKGTGLGLATVYGIVKQAGGHIHVRSELGRGTAFEVCFPRIQESPPALARSPERVALGGRERILVVEDDPQVRSVTVRTLHSVGYDVFAVSHPQDALELPPEEVGRLNLLVTDVVMPTLDGRVLAREMRHQHPALRVLYLSGYTPDTIAERGAAGPEGELLPKPFTGSALLAKVRAILDAN